MFEFLRKNIDVPFEKDAAHRFVPAIIGMMVFLATLALAAGSLITSVAEEWDAGYAPGYVVEFPIQHFETKQSVEVLEKSLFKALRGLPGVEKITMMPDNFSVSQGQTKGGQAPASYLIYDLTIRAGHSLETSDIEKRVHDLRKNMTVVDHKTLRAEKIKISNASVALSAIIAVIIGLAAVATISFVTYTGLDVHKSIIDILHTLGARKQYIAQQFQDQALILAIKGGIIGLVISVLVICGLGLIVNHIEVEFIRSGIEKSNMWIVVILTPILGLFLAILAARLTVMSALAERTRNC